MEIKELKTSDSLTRALQEAVGQKSSVDELHRQRVSFIYGSVSSKDGITHARIEEILAGHEGAQHR